MQVPYSRTNKEKRTIRAPPHVLFNRMVRSGVVGRKRRVLTDSHIFRSAKFFREWSFFSPHRLLIIGYSYHSIIYRMIQFGWIPHKLYEFYNLSRPYVIASYLSWNDILHKSDDPDAPPSTRALWRLSSRESGYWHEVVIMDPLRLVSGWKPRSADLGIVESRLAKDQHETLNNFDITDYEEQLKDPWYDRFHL